MPNSTKKSQWKTSTVISIFFEQFNKQNFSYLKIESESSEFWALMSTIFTL